VDFQCNVVLLQHQTKHAKYAILKFPSSLQKKTFFSLALQRQTNIVALCKMGFMLLLFKQFGTIVSFNQFSRIM
jgi:hypothetical protein